MSGAILGRWRSGEYKKRSIRYPATADLAIPINNETQKSPTSLKENKPI